MKYTRIVRTGIFLALVLFVMQVFAQTAPGGMTLQGRALKANHQPLEEANVEFTVLIRSPGAEDCLLFEESHSVNMTDSGGIFSIVLGSGTRSGTTYKDTSTLAQVFNNAGSAIGSLACATGATYTPATSHKRLLKVIVNDGSGPQPITEALEVQAVPYALYADSLQGKTPSDFMQNNSTTAALTQANAEAVFSSSSSVTELLALIAGTSTQFTKANGGNFTPVAAVSFNSQKITNLSDPTSSQDAATKNYCDTSIGAKGIDLSGVGSGTGDGKTLTWDATNNRWTTTTFSSSDATKLPLAGGTMSGNLNMGGNSIISSGNIGIGTAAPGEKLEVNGAIKIGTATGTADGTVRWSGTDFEGRKGGAWVSLTGASDGGGTVTSVSGTAPISVATGTTTPAISIADATTGAKGAVQVGTGLGVSSGMISVTYGTASSTAVQGNDARMNPSTVAGDAGKMLRVNAGGTVYELRTAAEVKTDLSLGTMASETATDYLSKAGNLSGLANTTTARSNLGVAIGTNVQAFSARLSEVAALSPTADNFIVGDGTNFVLKTPATARTSLGLGGAAILNVGTAAGTVAAGDDSRLSDSRTPTSHVHSAADVTSGTLVVARGGTNATSFTADSLVLTNVTGTALGSFAPCSSGQVMGSNGTAWGCTTPSAGLPAAAGTAAAPAMHSRATRTQECLAQLRIKSVCQQRDLSVCALMPAAM